MNRPGQVRASAIVSSVVVLPFIVLQFVNGGGLNDFPVLLFGVMWLLGFLFLFVVTTRWLSLPVRIVMLIVLTFCWTGLVIDQMPCFLGVPNCD